MNKLKQKKNYDSTHLNIKFNNKKNGAQIHKLKRIILLCDYEHQKKIINLPKSWFFQFGNHPTN